MNSAFSIALISTVAVAVKLNDAFLHQGLRKSQVEGPRNGFPIDKCTDMVPKEYDDPVCYEGEWIEFDWLDDPNFWACGKKPRGWEYAVCNHDTGEWEEYALSTDVEDHVVCGELPDTEDYVVCNHETHTWEKFQAVDKSDFTVCGKKPAKMGFATCNYETEKWNAVGSIHPPGRPICGNRPKHVSRNAVCDAETGEWRDVLDHIKKEFATCEGVPPAGVRFPVCNVATGRWEDEYIAMEQKTFDEAFRAPAEPVIAADGTIVMDEPAAKKVDVALSSGKVDAITKAEK